MAFKSAKYDIEKWLGLENSNILQKVCNIYDVDGFLVEQYKTRISIVPAGTFFNGQESVDAPALKRSFTYSDESNAIASLPSVAEWTQQCEDAAQGADPFDPLDPGGIPNGLKVARSLYTYDEQLAVASNIETTIISYTVGAEENVYLRHVTGNGGNKGSYKVYIDGVTKQSKCSWWTSFHVDFRFDTANGGIYVESGSTISLKVVNDSNTAATFDGSIGYVIA